jgi:glycosyltransferase involved in cell wall biosynthesis
MKNFQNSPAPAVSIVITCFNDGIFLTEAINSVLKLQAVEYEIIIVNDGSTDETTLQLLNEYRKYGYFIVDQPNSGAPAARNNGVGKAKAPYILLLDADNYIEPEYVYEGVRILNSEPGTGVVYSDCYIFGVEQGKRQLPDFDFPRLLAGNYIDNCAVFRKKIWDDAGGQDTNPALKAHQDWDIWITAGAAGWHFHHIPQCLYHYRIKPVSISTSVANVEDKRKIHEYITNKHRTLMQDHITSIVSFLIKNIYDRQDIIQNQKHEITHLKDYNKSLNASITDLQHRITRLENRLFAKIKRLVAKALKILGSTENQKKGGASIIKKAIFFIGRQGRKVLRTFVAKFFKQLYLIFEERKVTFIFDDNVRESSNANDYQSWIAANKPDERQLSVYASQAETFVLRPLISIIVPVYDPPIIFLREAIESVIDQVYDNWELCIADDCSTDPEVRKILEHFEFLDKRIKVTYRKENGHISACSNTALELATGEFILLLDQDDLLSKDALFHIVNHINKFPESDFIYSDEDKVDELDNFSNPHFKPAWCPDSLLSRNYCGHLVLLRTALVRKIGGFRLGFEGSQDYDLLLRFTEQTDNIYRIPRVLYHWRIHEASTASASGAKPYAYTAAQKAISEAITRRHEPGIVSILPESGSYVVRYHIQSIKKVSVIIPTRNQAKVLGTCLNSIFDKTDYPDYEVILIDNRSDEEDLFALVKSFEKSHPGRFRCIKADIDFNFSRLMNIGVANAAGSYILLLNNDTEIIDGSWMRAMVEQAQRKSIGAVGVKLVYPNNTIQHAGVVVGMGGVAAHTFAGYRMDEAGYFNYIRVVSNYSAVTAACLMCRKEVFEEVGGFDEEFAIEFNDIDFCLKIKEAGYQNIYLPYVSLYHYESLTRGHPKSSDESLNRHLAEVKRFQQKWDKYVYMDPCFNPNLSLWDNDFKLKV